MTTVEDVSLLEAPNSFGMTRIKMGVILALLATGISAHAVTLSFTRVTSNASTDIATDISLFITDLGSGEALFELIKGTTHDGFVRNIYFEDPGSRLSNILFSSDNSTPEVIFADPSDPADPPGIGSFVTAASFDADSPTMGVKHGVEPGETGAFTATYTGSYADLEQALLDEDIRMAVHAQGLEGGASDSFVTTVPEPSVGILGCLALLVTMRRRR